MLQRAPLNRHFQVSPFEINASNRSLFIYSIGPEVTHNTTAWNRFSYIVCLFTLLASGELGCIFNFDFSSSKVFVHLDCKLHKQRLNIFQQNDHTFLVAGNLNSFK